MHAETQPKAAHSVATRLVLPCLMALVVVFVSGSIPTNPLTVVDRDVEAVAAFDDVSFDMFGLGNSSSLGPPLAITMVATLCILMAVRAHESRSGLWHRTTTSRAPPHHGIA